MELQMRRSYAKAYVEILEIINHMGEEYKRKIPHNLLDFFEEHKDKNYFFQLAEIKNNMPIFLDETISLIAMLEYKYWAKLEEKEILDKALKKNEREYQKQLNEKYNADNLFKKTKIKDETEGYSVAMVEYKEAFFKRFINKLKSFFKIK